MRKPCQQRQQPRSQQAQDQLPRLQEANTQRPPSQRREPDQVVSRPPDPESALGLAKAPVFRPLYTVQTSRDVDSPLLLAYEVVAQAREAAPLLPMRGRRRHLTGRALRDLWVDCG